MKKGLLLYFTVLFIGVIFIARLFYIQIINVNHDPLQSSTIRKKIEYPHRGYVFDRNGTLLVANQISYDIMIVPKEVKPLDTIEFCNLLGIDKQYFKTRFLKSKKYSPRLPSVFVGQLSKEDYARFQEKKHKYKGFYVQKRFLRKYPIKSAANVLGYISEVNENLIQKNPYYQLGELIGTAGVEKSYEKQLRGKKGVKYFQRDIYNKNIGPYKDGAFDTVSLPGKDLTLTIDSQLQQYGEALMQNKRGGIVAIEPSSGEILALVSLPTYDPNMMVGRKRSINSVKLFGDTIQKPMLDRGLQSMYPPGSPFKILTGLIGLQEGIIDTNTIFYCYHGYKYGRKGFMGCHDHKSNVNLHYAIYTSCNTYFAQTYRKIIEKYENPFTGMNAWNKHVKSFGLGAYFGNDLASGQKGLIPDGSYYNKWYPSKRWTATYTLSNAIGQGEILTTPIQLANMTAAIANRGFYYTPHIVKKIKNLPLNKTFTTPKYTSIDTKYFSPIIAGMYDVFENPHGTAHSSKVKDIAICGKTGTAENYIKVNGKRIKLTDHSIFIAFAPKDNPKIAIAVFVENGYWGSQWAGPIATLMIEKYLKGKTSRHYLEQRMFNGSLEDEYQKQLDLENYNAEEQ